MDRLIVLKDRVLFTIDEYETLLKSLNNLFKNNDVEQIDYLLRLEAAQSKSLNQRVKIFKSYLEILKNNRITVTDHESEVYNKLDDLYEHIKIFRETLILEQQKLNKELYQVKKIVKPLGRLRDETARRIDITT